MSPLRAKHVSVDIIAVWKFASNFKIGLIVYFLFCFLQYQKKKESLWNIFIVITKPFLCFEGVLKIISQEQFKKTTTKNSKFNANFQVWCKYLHFNYDMIYALRLKNENCSTCNQIAELRKWLYLKFVGDFRFIFYLWILSKLC